MSPQAPRACEIEAVAVLICSGEKNGSVGACSRSSRSVACARDIGLLSRTTPVSSPQSNGMAEAFVRILKRDYVRVNPRPDVQTVIEQLAGWMAHYNEVHPNRVLGYRSPREYIAQTREACQAFSGQQHGVCLGKLLAFYLRPVPGFGLVYVYVYALCDFDI